MRVYADLIAAGLSPLELSAAQVAAAWIFLEEMDRLAAARTDFAFETTLSGRGYMERIKHWKAAGYRVEIVFLKLPSVQLALKRVALRVEQGGHHLPDADVRRRFFRGWLNFETGYKRIVNGWAVFDNTGETSNSSTVHMARSTAGKEHDEFVAAVGRGLKHAAKLARKTARMHGTPIALWRDGKVVLEKHQGFHSSVSSAAHTPPLKHSMTTWAHDHMGTCIFAPCARSISSPSAAAPCTTWPSPCTRRVSR